MLPPLAERELRVALLRRGARRQWVAAVWIAGALTSVFLFVAEGMGVSASGRGLFLCLFVLQFLVVVGRGFKLTADLLSEERRNGTLGLLVLTGLKPLEIFSGKLLGAALLAANAAIGTLPFLAVSFLVGGVPPQQFIGALVSLVNVLLFCIALGLLASAASREGGDAQVTAVGLAVILSCAPPLVYWIAGFLAGAPVLAADWFTLSPLYAPYLVLTGFTGGSTRLFWTTCGVTLVYSLMALLAAAVILQRTWRDSPEELARRTPAAPWLNWLRGSPLWRGALREQLLEEQPFAWLAARNRRFVLAAKVFSLLVGLAWMAALLLRDPSGSIMAISLAASIVLHQGLNWFLAYSAAAALSEERQTGGFEVLLTTPLPVESIVEGQHRALMIQFKPILVTAMLLDVLFAISVIVYRQWWGGGGFWFGVGWGLWMGGWMVAHRVTPSMAMWVGAWTGRPAYAALVAVRPVILLMLTCMPVKSPQVLMKKLIRELRLIACAPIPARGDGRYSSWNPEEIFPPGRWGDFPLREAKLAKTRSHGHALKRTWSRSARLLPPGCRNERL